MTGPVGQDEELDDDLRREQMEDLTKQVMPADYVRLCVCASPSPSPSSPSSLLCRRPLAPRPLLPPACTISTQSGRWRWRRREEGGRESWMEGGREEGGGRGEMHARGMQAWRESLNLFSFGADTCGSIRGRVGCFSGVGGKASGSWARLRCAARAGAWREGLGAWAPDRACAVLKQSPRVDTRLEHASRPACRLVALEPSTRHARITHPFLSLLSLYRSLPLHTCLAFPCSPASPAAIQVPSEKQAASMLKGSAVCGGLQAALQRAGGAEGRELIHIRAGHHFNGGDGCGSFTVGPGGNVTMLADFGSQVWGRWSLQASDGLSDGSEGVVGARRREEQGGWSLLWLYGLTMRVAGHPKSSRTLERLRRETCTTTHASFARLPRGKINILGMRNGLAGQVTCSKVGPLHSRLG